MAKLMERKQFTIKAKRPSSLLVVGQPATRGLTEGIAVDIYPTHTPKDKQWIELATQCYKAQELRKFYTLEEDKLKGELVALSGNESAKGSHFVLTKIPRNGTVQYKNIPAIKVMSEVELNMYRGAPTVSWKLEKK